MKTLTYGTVPDFQDFAKAFDATAIDDTGLYAVVLPNNRDYLNLQEAGLLQQYSSIVPVAQQTPRFEREEVKGMGAGAFGARACYYYTAAQLYRLIENLAELHRIDSDEAYADWAGNFASSILTTLGFEWV